MVAAGSTASVATTLACARYAPMPAKYPDAAQGVTFFAYLLVHDTPRGGSGIES
jgi:hypothetical protein